MTPGPADEHFDVAVIGAGMAGLRAADRLTAAGRHVIVLDKGRRHGGRMATRRVDDATFDTGAIAFTAQDADLATALSGWVTDGHVERWDASDAAMTASATTSVSTAQWRGTPMMRSLPTALASQLEQHAPPAQVRLATQVRSIGRDPRGFVILSEHAGQATTLHAGAVVLTAPAPQSIALLEGAQPLAKDATLALLRDVTYTPSLTVLVRPVDRSVDARMLPAASALGPGTRAPDLLRAHRNDLSGASSIIAVTLQADPAFSAAHLDGDRNAAAARLAAQASAVVETELEVVHVHGWRYAQVHSGIACGDALPALLDASSGAPLVLAGDLFAASWPDIAPSASAVASDGVERAFRSGGAAAELLLTDEAAPTILPDGS
jgi:predicted NAD/FAD-dependent oxidoreductase